MNVSMIVSAIETAPVLVTVTELVREFVTKIEKIEVREFRETLEFQHGYVEVVTSLRNY